MYVSACSHGRIVLTVWLSYVLFIYQSEDIWIVPFFLAATNNASVNICIQVFVCFHFSWLNPPEWN